MPVQSVTVIDTMMHEYMIDPVDHTDKLLGSRAASTNPKMIAECAAAINARLQKSPVLN